MGIPSATMTHLTPTAHSLHTMMAAESPFVLNESPDLLVGQLVREADHAGTGRAVLDHPEDFAFSPMAPESVVLKIAGRGIELSRQRPVSVALGSMAIDTGAFARVERLALFNRLRRVRQRAPQRLSLRHLVRRDARPHHIMAGRPRRGPAGEQRHEQGCRYRQAMCDLRHLRTIQERAQLTLSPPNNQKSNSAIFR